MAADSIGELFSIDPSHPSRSDILISITDIPSSCTSAPTPPVDPILISTSIPIDPNVALMG